MTRKDALLQYFFALIVFLLFSLWIKTPGYMDAEYYTLSAARIASGNGLTQPVIWNYLDDPTGFPHPSHTYWMPAPSLIASIGMAVSGQTDFEAGRLLFILIAALAAPAAGWVGFRLSGKRKVSWLAAGFAIFNGYYSPYTATTDSFFLIMAGAWVVFFNLDKALKAATEKTTFLWLFAGIGAGWQYLNRADGLLWLGMVIVVWLFSSRRMLSTGKTWFQLFLVLTGFLLPTGFWFARNLSIYGSIVVPHVSRTLWMTSYNELFIYPPDILTFSRWAATGLPVIIKDRISALAHNLTAVAVVQGHVILFPFWMAAIWKHRKENLVQLAMGMEIVILLVMAVVFPYSGMQGGFLHSSAGLQPIIWGLAAAGFLDVIEWIAGKRNWKPERAYKMFSIGLVALCGLITLFVFQMVVIGQNPEKAAWDENQRRAILAEHMLEKAGITKNEAVLINNPAGFALVSGRNSLVIPDGSPQTMLDVAGKFHVKYIILEKAHVSGLSDLYNQPQEFPAFELLDTTDDLRLLRISSEGEKGG